MAALSASSTAKKVDVYIIAEAFCPNCKEHSYLLDKLVMSKGDDMRKIMDLKLDMVRA
jgi:predicted nucleic-acid-binding Zn-ribbon protein